MNTNKLIDALSCVENTPFGIATKNYFLKDSFADAFCKAPASTRYHRTYEGGLLDHCLEVLEFYEYILDCISIDYDHSENICTALLHDVSKVYMYVPSLAPPPYVIPTYDTHSIFPMIDFEARTGKNIPKHIADIIRRHMGPWSEEQVFPETLQQIAFYSADHLSATLNKPK